MLSVEQGEFQCPLCRQLANVFLPILPSVLPVLPSNLANIYNDSLQSEHVAQSDGSYPSDTGYQKMNLWTIIATIVGCQGNLGS